MLTLSWIWATLLDSEKPHRPNTPRPSPPPPHIGVMSYCGFDASAAMSIGTPRSDPAIARSRRADSSAASTATGSTPRRLRCSNCAAALSCQVAVLS